ncbi:hypothetical protein HBH70_009400 [Parastagonospora nodorum]|nr:hypothetical protein HBH51_011110 [Parastagonospora nodorum]KAH3987843.1 hypothetical protein HBH52_036300 [Parastagonospora nodorum]KAH4073305.1 hypothetical protein HBH50_052310 [Parastagonospora nodorum]KAH4099636.1 hypothetical protein HBH48_009840 [Parastagonospora nodorum]KAH4235112.1 hypothetical protein HBI06_057900 [Parastagonospora nodorum]
MFDVKVCVMSFDQMSSMTIAELPPVICAYQLYTQALFLLKQAVKTFLTSHLFVHYMMSPQCGYPSRHSNGEPSLRSHTPSSSGMLICQPSFRNTPHNFVALSPTLVRFQRL